MRYRVHLWAIQIRRISKNNRLNKAPRRPVIRRNLLCRQLRHQAKRNSQSNKGVSATVLLPRLRDRVRFGLLLPVVGFCLLKKTIYLATGNHDSAKICDDLNLSSIYLAIAPSVVPAKSEANSVGDKTTFSDVLREEVSMLFCLEQTVGRKKDGLACDEALGPRSEKAPPNMRETHSSAAGQSLSSTY